MDHNSSIPQSRPAEIVTDVHQGWPQAYVYSVIVALLVVICFPVIAFVRRWIVKRRLVRETAKKYEAIDQELCSPEELFAEKILNEEYDDALDIASRYNLNPDPVYQKQWIRENISLQTISDFLIKIADKQWVISECLNKVPVTLEAANALLDVGICLTESDQFVTFAASDEDSEITDFRQLRRDDFAKFSTQEKELVISRCQLLRFQRRLRTLHRILGGDGIADVHFSADVYHKFREQSVLESAVTFARSANFDAVSVLFTCHGDETLDHWLLILSNFPEVVSPFLYQKLLPDCGISDSEVYPWETSEPHDEDWSDVFSPYGDESGDFADSLYKQSEFRHLSEFCGQNMSKTQLTKWFRDRARQIEQVSSLVDNALQLVKLGIQKNLTGLMQLHQDLEIFSVIIYDCFPRVDPMPELFFDEFLLLKPSQVIDLLMIESEKDGKRFVECIRKFLIPFLQKIDPNFKIGDLHPQLEQFLVKTAAKDISLVTSFFQECVSDPETRKSAELCLGLNRIDDLLTLALNILYQDVREQPAFLDNAFSIVECLPQRSPKSTPDIDALQDRVDVLEKHLAVCEACEKYSCRVSPMLLLQLQQESKPAEVTAFFQDVIHRAVKSCKSCNESEWMPILNDILLIRKDCFPDIISKEQIHHLFVRCLLTHGKQDFISLAQRFMKSLGVDANDAAILIIAGETALARNDYHSCFDICKKLMSLTSVTDASLKQKTWRLCLELGSDHRFPSSRAKMQLLSYALTYCDTDEDGGRRLTLIIDAIIKLKEKIRKEGSEADEDSAFTDVILSATTQNVKSHLKNLVSWLTK